MTETVTPAETAVDEKVDLFDDAVLLNPYPPFAELRERAPVVHLPRNDAYALTRYATIRKALKDWESFSSSKIAFNDDMNNALQGTSLTADPPAHQQIRATLVEPLSPRALKKLKDDIQVKADQVVAELVDRGSFDAVNDLARSLPIQVVADMIGLQGSARENALRWGDSAFNVMGPMNQRTIDNFPIAGELFGWVSQVTPDQLAEDSVGRGIFESAEKNGLPQGTANKIIHQYVAAGMDTTISSIGHAIDLLGRHPEQYAILREDPSLALSAYNEVLRYEAPAHAFGRLATGEVELDGTVIPEGAQVAILWGSGNRDHRHYEDPDTFQVRRNPIDHLSFGYGVHTCAGQGLARLQATSVLSAWVRRVKSFSVGEATRRISNQTHSLETCPVTEVVPA